MAICYSIFKNCQNHLCRFETRVYADDTKHFFDKGRCLGYFYLKNPGSAQPTVIEEFSPVKLNNDKTIGYLHNLLYDIKIKYIDLIGDHDYFQIVNLFPIVDNDIGDAINALKRINHTEKFLINNIEALKSESLFVFFCWGSEQKLKNLREIHLKNISFHLNTKLFYIEYCKNKYSNTIEGLPEINSKPKHIIGLPKQLLYDYLNKLFEKGLVKFKI